MPNVSRWCIYSIYFVHMVYSYHCVGRSTVDLHAITTQQYTPPVNTPHVQYPQKRICMNDTGLVFFTYKDILVNHMNMSISTQACAKTCSLFVCGDRVSKDACICSAMIAEVVMYSMESCSSDSECTTESNHVPLFSCRTLDYLKDKFCLPAAVPMDIVYGNTQCDQEGGWYEFKTNQCYIGTLSMSPATCNYFLNYSPLVMTCIGLVIVVVMSFFAYYGIQYSHNEPPESQGVQIACIDTYWEQYGNGCMRGHINRF